MTSGKVQSDWVPEDFGAERHACLDALRERGAAQHSSRLGLAVLRHRDVVAVAGDPATFSNVRVNKGEAEPSALRGIPLEYDPPQHTAYRDLLKPLFAPGRMNAFSARVAEMARRELTPLIDAGAVDIVENFADPFPVKVVCELIGWELDDWRLIKAKSEAVRIAMANRDKQALDAAHRWWADYIRPVMANRRAAPREDATSWLLSQRIDDRPLSEAEIISILRLLLVAGHGTTTASLGIVIDFLARNADVQEQLRANPRDIARAIEEMLRLTSPLAAMQRTVMADADVAGVRVCAGERVALMYSAANRDPEVFADPLRFDMTRSPNPHLVFGSGIHRCLGAPLARVELQTVVGVLLALTSRIGAAGPGGRVNATAWPTNDLAEFQVELVGA